MFPFSHLVRLCKADGAPRVLRIKAQACQRMVLHGFLRVWDPLGYTPEEKEHVWEELLSNISLLMLIRTETNDRLLVSCTKPAWRRETIRCFNSTAAHQKQSFRHQELCDMNARNRSSVLEALMLLPPGQKGDSTAVTGPIHCIRGRITLPLCTCA